MISKKIRFEAAHADQIDLLKLWLKKPYIHKYWGNGGLTLPDLNKFVAGEPSIFSHYFAYSEEIPIAYLMTSVIEPNEKSPYVQYRATEGGTLSFDFMIGNEDCLGKGLSHLILKEFFRVKCASVAHMLTDPETRNTKAIHCYEKSGFSIEGTFISQDEPYAGTEHTVLTRGQ